ncbi:MAG: ChaN family lipoprotein [candidate division Zixibacteria bacterium]|nr:ChaN family lipoprotein [candidate division Zixibacteria bacterium]
MRRLLPTLFLAAVLVSCDGANPPDDSRLPLPQLPAEIASELSGYLDRHHLAPESYVLSKFENHDVVILGEFHRIKHDLALVHNLIPKLRAAGVYTLAMEFANWEDQADIDRLLTAPVYDEALARQIQFNQWPFWGFQEYIDIYKVAWELNHNLPDTARRFRVVGLNASADWSLLKTEADLKNPELMKRIWAKGSSDENMAATARREIVETHEKALVYCGIYHGFTKYRRPYYAPNSDSVDHWDKDRLGHSLYQQLGDRVFLINLHAPWPPAGSFSGYTYPVDGVIDALMAELGTEYYPVGFDIVGSPFASLTATQSYWGNGKDDFTLGDYCDGYIFTRPLSQYDGVTVAEGFYHEGNRLATLNQSANPASKDTARSVASIIESTTHDANMRQRFKDLR